MRAQRTQCLPKFGEPHLSWSRKLDRTVTLSERYHIDVNHWSTGNKKTKFIPLKKHVTFGKKLLEHMTTNEVEQELYKQQIPISQ